MTSVPGDELHELYEADQASLLARLEREQVPVADRALPPPRYVAQLTPGPVDQGAGTIVGSWKDVGERAREWADAGRIAVIQRVKEPRDR